MVLDQFPIEDVDKQSGVVGLEGMVSRSINQICKAISQVHSVDVRDSLEVVQKYLEFLTKHLSDMLYEDT